MNLMMNKGHQVKQAKFSDGNEWGQIRSHVSNNGEGTDTVKYTVEMDGLSTFGISLIVKYAF